MAIVKTNSAFADTKKATIADYERHRLLGVSCGEFGTRKTSLWLEGPGPVVVWSIDGGLEGVVSRYLRQDPKKEYYIFEYQWGPSGKEDNDEEEKLAAREVRDRFLSDFEKYLPHTRTGLIDKENQLWALFRFAEWGRQKGDNQRDFEPVNARYRRILNAIKASNANFGFISGLKDEWGKSYDEQAGRMKSGPTGRRIRSGYKELEEAVNLVLHHYGQNQNDWSIRIDKARGTTNPDIVGSTFSLEDIPDFQTLGQLVFSDSEPEEWL